MEMRLMDLTAEQRQGMVSVLNGAGLKEEDVIIHQDGEQFIIEVKPMNEAAETQFIKLTSDML
ncbi:hypothetical protein [Exiguobacterium aurantiacum]|uniref:hypothetical protein n=1 Tax=Exiguobacterium aurantiacum TaxID=33987 RepID=UPI00385154F9